MRALFRGRTATSMAPPFTMATGTERSDQADLEPNSIQDAVCLLRNRWRLPIFGSDPGAATAISMVRRRVACPGSLGTVFKITPGGKLTTLFSFNYASGGNSYSPLLLATDGNLYGVCSRAVQERIRARSSESHPGGTVTKIYDFTPDDGAFPYGANWFRARTATSTARPQQALCLLRARCSAERRAAYGPLLTRKRPG